MLFNFEHITLPSTPNYCLVAPGQNTNKRWLEPKIFNLSKTALKARWAHMLRQQPRITMIQQEHDQIEYVQRSKIFKFKDTIVVQFKTIDESHSTLYLYSHSQSGYWDFGVNCRRVHHWLRNV